MDTTLTFETRFNAGYYAILDGRVIGQNSTGAETAEDAKAEFFTNRAWPGCYPVVYIDAAGSVLCGDCARKDFDELGDVAEGSITEESDYTLCCDGCGKVIQEQNLCPEHGADDTGENPDGSFRCFVCQPRTYRVVSGVQGSAREDFDSHADDAAEAGFTLDEAIADAESYVADLCEAWPGATAMPAASVENYWVIDRDPGSPTAPILYVEVVPFD